MDFLKDPIGYLHGHSAPSCYKEVLYVSEARLLFRENFEPSWGRETGMREYGTKKFSLILSFQEIFSSRMNYQNNFDYG